MSLPVIHVGKTRFTRIAVWMDAEDARTLAEHYGSNDLAYQELRDAADEDDANVAALRD